MKKALPSDEPTRPTALCSYHILDTPPEKAFDDIANLAALVCGTPKALVSFDDGHRQWIKARVGFELTEIKRDHAFCGHTLLERDVLVVPDATQDARFVENPLVSGPLGIRFYAGVPVINAQGDALGTLAVMDSRPRQLDEAQKEALRALGRQVIAQLELRRHSQKPDDLDRQTDDELRIKDNALGSSALAIAFADLEGRITYANRALVELLGYETTDQIEGRFNTEFTSEPERVREIMEVLRTQGRWKGELNGVRRNGSLVQVHLSSSLVTDAEGKPLCTMASFIDLTEQRRAERRFRQLLDSAPDAMILVKPDGEMALVNSQAERLFGYARTELLGQPIEKLLPERFRKAHIGHRAGFAAHPVARPMGASRELYGRRKDGSEFPIEVSLSPFEFGEDYSVMCAVRDVTERKLIEAKANESATRYAGLMESVDGVVWEVELPALRFTFVSPQAERILGYPVQRWLDEPSFWAEHIHPEDRAQAVNYCLSRTAAGEKHDFKYRMLAADGRVVWIHDLVTVLVENGRPAKLRGLMVDITEHQRAEAALRESEERFQKLVEQAADAFFLHDDNGKVLDVNRRACESLGYGRDELLGKGIFEIEQDYQLDEAKKIWSQIRPGESGTISGHHRRKDGTTFPVEVRWGCLDVGGQRVFLDLARDITERAESEAIREVILSLGTKLSAASTPGEAAQTIFSAADQLWKWDAGTLDVYSPTDDRVWAVMYMDVIDGKRRQVLSTDSLVEPTPRMRRIMKEGAELILRRAPLVQNSDGIMFGDTKRLSASLLCVPIRWKGEPLGVLSIQSYTPNAFTESDLKILQALADHCGGTLERIRIVEALRASEARFRAMVEAEPECVKIVTAGGQLTQMNPAGLAMLEVDSLEEAKSRPLLDWIAPEHRAAFLQLHRRVIGGESGVLEFEIISARGMRRWLETRAVPLSNEDGQHTALLGVTRDITDRKQADAALRESQTRMQLATQAADIGPWDWDVRSGKVHFSREWKRQLGYEEHEIQNSYEEWESRLHSEDRPATIEALKAYLAGERAEYAVEFRLRHKDNSYRWIFTRGEVVRDAAGQPYRMLGCHVDITARKQVEEAVRASQSMLQTILDNIPQGVFWKDRQSRYLGYNQVVVRAFAITRPDDILGKTDHELHGLTPEQAEFFMQKDREVMETGLPQMGIVEQATVADGTEVWLETNKIPLRDENGNVTGVLGTWQDITERKKAEEKVRASEARLARAQRIARLGSWEVDLERGTLQWSDQTFHIFGLGPETFTPTRESFYEFVHPEDRARVRRTVEDAVRSSQPYHVEHRILRPDDSVRFVSEHADVQTDAEGKPIRLVGTVLDITRLKEVELALQNSERHFRSLIENAQDLITVIDTSGVIRFQSPSVHRLLGYAPEDVIGRSAFDFIHAQDKASVQSALDRALQDSDDPITSEFRFQHADGSWRTFESIGRRLSNAEPPVVVVNSRDVTERKHLEEQLRQSQKMDAIGQLAGGVAHDFNNLLTVIQGNASLLLMSGKCGDKETEFAKQISVTAERAAALTRQLLLFGRKQMMQLRDLDLNDVVANMSKMLHRILGEDIKLQLEPAANLPLVHADAGMIEQILLNFAVNSRDAMPKGGRLIIRTQAAQIAEEFVRHNPHAKPGHFTCLSVLDTGCGIAPEHLPHIFEPFFTTKEVGKGTGLGLATVYGIVRQHEGWINVRSEVGQGTAFDVYLPALSRPASLGDGRASQTELRGGTETILLVEDESDVRGLARLVLERLGYTVLEARHGPEALEVWRKRKATIQLLLTDMIMPEGLTGRDVAEKLRKERPELPVIYTSGYSSDIFGQGVALQSGMNFLQKPYLPSELAHAVREGLNVQARSN